MLIMVKMLVMIVFGLVRPRLSIRVHALAPTLSQRDVLLANVVANGQRPPFSCGNLALPLAALPLAALLVTALAPPLAAVVHNNAIPLSPVLLATAFALARALIEQFLNGLPRGPPVVFHGAFAPPIKTAISLPEGVAVRDDKSCVRTFGARGRPEQVTLGRALVVDIVEQGRHGA